MFISMMPFLCRQTGLWNGGWMAAIGQGGHYSQDTLQQTHGLQSVPVPVPLFLKAHLLIWEEKLSSLRRLMWPQTSSCLLSTIQNT